MLAYDYPLAGVFWTVTIIFFWMAWWFAAIWCFIDNFRRHDHPGWAKAVWAVVIIVIPVIGVFAYIVSRPRATDVEMIGGEYAGS